MIFLRFVFVAMMLRVLAPLASTAEEPAPERAQILATMKRATAFMVEKVSHRGGYVWHYLPDFSRRWGELEATPTMIWIQPPGTPAMGQVFLDAYHVTHDEYYYHAAERTAAALIAAQHASGGWNYLFDFAGPEALKKWHETVGRNAWRLEEFQHFQDNATFDDQTTAAAARFLLRFHGEKGDARAKAALDRALALVLESQSQIGAWPQRFPPSDASPQDGTPDYASYLTLNDNVTGENIAFLVEAYGQLRDERLLAAARRGMDAVAALQQPAPHPGWAMQYTPDLEPAAARSYEPKALATHATASCIAQLLEFYELTGERNYLARIPEALAWLEAVKLPPDLLGARGTHPTFVELGTGKPLFIHRRGSNVVSGRYYSDYDAQSTLGHYSSFRSIDLAGLRARFAKAAATPSETASKDSPLRPAARPGLPKIVSAQASWLVNAANREANVATLVASLNADGYWPTPLRTTSHPYRGEAPREPTAGDFSRSHVGDSYDTSPFGAPQPVPGISTGSYIRNMTRLLLHLEAQRPTDSAAQTGL